MTPETFMLLLADADELIRRAGRISLLIGGAGAAAFALGWVLDAPAFYRSYLIAWMFWLGVSLGSLGLVMMHHVTGGAWGDAIRRFAEAAAMNLPILVILFIPIAIGASSLYPWARHDIVAMNPILQHRRPYLNVPFFIIRAIVYFVVWIGLAGYLFFQRAQSRPHVMLSEAKHLGNPRPFASLRVTEERGIANVNSDGNHAARVYGVSAVGLLVYFLTMSLASVDWVMSRETNWHSTIFGLAVIAGQGVAGLCFVMMILSFLSERPPLRGAVSNELYNDLGNLLQTMVILWTYLVFVQLLVCWMGNTQEDIVWYVHRLNGGWQWIALSLLVLHFFVPFVVLLLRDVKRNRQAMLILCMVLLVMRIVENFWLVAPSGDETFPTLGSRLSWMDFVFPVGMGGMWMAAFCRIVHARFLMRESGMNPSGERLHGV